MYHVLKLIALIGLIALISWGVQQLLPWWSVACVAAALCCGLNTRLLESFICGLLATGGLWLILAWRIHLDTAGGLSNKMTILFGVQDPMFLIVATGLIGGITSGLGALCGSACRNLWRQKKKRRTFYA